MNPKVAHLFLTDKCTNQCPMCCNNNYTVDSIPFITKEELSTVETVCLTGGEPFLLDNLYGIVNVISSFAKNIYVYTSGYELLYYLKKHTLPCITGISICPKGKKDWDALQELVHNTRARLRISECSNRLYVLLKQEDRANYVTETDISLRTIEHFAEELNAKILFRTWLPEITSPDGEIFRRINLEDLKQWKSEL